MKIHIFIVWLAGILNIGALAQNSFDQEVNRISQLPDYKNATIGIVIADAESGNSFYEVNGQKFMIPASTLKLVTTASVLEILGGEYRFKTLIGYDGIIDVNNVLQGNMIIKSGGDPTLGSKYFSDDRNDFTALWTSKIKEAGIKKITGNLILNNSNYQIDEVPATWTWEDIGNYYGAAPNAFTCYDNLFTITFKSDNTGEKTEIIKTIPEIEALKFDNRVLGADDESDNAYVFGSPLDKTRILRGTIPKNRSDFSIKAAVPNPAELMATSLIGELRKAGIEFAGKVEINQPAESQIHVIYENQSPALSEITKVVNHESVNLFAEHLLIQVAAEKSGTGKTGAGIDIAETFWRSKYVEGKGLIMEDGSGLSHFNLVSPGFLTNLLVYMNKSHSKEAFLNSLPSAGLGTLSAFSTEKFPGNTLKAKSGSMSRVRCYAGYLTLDSGKIAAFAIMFNHFSGSQSKLRGEIEKLLLEAKKSY